MTVIKELRDENARLNGTIKKYERELSAMTLKYETKLSEMIEILTKLQHRLNYYENPHSPPSKNSIPTKQRKAKAQRNSSAPAPNRRAPGRRKGHRGISHERKPTHTEHHKPERVPDAVTLK